MVVGRGFGISNAHIIDCIPKIPRIDDSRLAEIFAREVLAMLVGRELLSPEWAERLLSWRHTGFSIHSLVWATTKTQAERVGKYMIWPLLSLERLSFEEVDRIIDHLKLTFVAERPPPPRAASQELLMAADPPVEYFS